MTKQDFLEYYCIDVTMQEASENLDKLIEQTIAEHEATREQDYPDIEADGCVFCGKCGKMKGV